MLGKEPGKPKGPRIPLGVKWGHGGVGIFGPAAGGIFGAALGLSGIPKAGSSRAGAPTELPLTCGGSKVGQGRRAAHGQAVDRPAGCTKGRSAALLGGLSDFVPARGGVGLSLVR